MQEAEYSAAVNTLPNPRQAVQQQQQQQPTPQQQNQQQVQQQVKIKTRSLQIKEIFTEIISPLNTINRYLNTFIIFVQHVDEIPINIITVRK